ncbi:hypothetical protein [Williamsia sp. DF01-3]
MSSLRAGSGLVAAARSVEVRMLAGMTGREQSEAFRLLRSMIDSLRDVDG